MNIRTLSGIACLILSIACQSPGNRNDGHVDNDAHVDVDQEQRYSFLRTEGTDKQDTSFIQLVVRGETVSGVYNVIPHEKDAKRGTVLGKLTDEVFDLVWTFTQEGIQDTLRLAFMLQDGKLLREPLAVDTVTGRQVTMNSGSFSEAYDAIDCAPTTEGGYAGSR